MNKFKNENSTEIPRENWEEIILADIAINGPVKMEFPDVFDDELLNEWRND